MTGISSERSLVSMAAHLALDTDFSSLPSRKLEICPPHNHPTTFAKRIELTVLRYEMGRAAHVKRRYQDKNG
jgi:hypothetical protein